MAGFALLIRTYDGVVVIADKENSYEQTTAIIKINKNTIALVFGGLDGAKKFCNEHLKDITDDDDIAKIRRIANDKFQKYNQEYKNTNFSLVLVAFERSRRTIFHGIWFIDGVPTSQELPDNHIFIKTVEDLAQYLVNKVYSDHMWVDELAKLASFVTLQCIKIFRVGIDFDFVTLSEKETKWFTPDEVKEQLHIQEKIDHKLKKDFSNFFLSGEDSQ